MPRCFNLDVGFHVKRLNRELAGPMLQAAQHSPSTDPKLQNDMCHTPLQVRAVIAVTLGVAPRAPLPPIVMQQEQPNIMLQTGAATTLSNCNLATATSDARQKPLNVAAFSLVMPPGRPYVGNASFVS